MKIFDLHTDILYDVYVHKKAGDNTRFKSYHCEQLNRSLVQAGIWTLYSPSDFDLLKALKLALSSIDFNLIDNFDIILGLEGLRNLKSIDEFKSIYNLGIRHAMLTWNEENEYATGVFGSENRGVTKKGYEVLDFMVEKDMIIDLSHLNEKSFYDVVEYTNKNIIVSHSNIRQICDHPRNLSIAQLKKLKSIDGLIGLTLAGTFIHEDPNLRTIATFMEHLKIAIEIMGVDNVCFGFDFMDYLSPNNKNIEEIPNVEFLNKLIVPMQTLGLSLIDIKKIFFDNFYNRFKRHIIKGKGKQNE